MSNIYNAANNQIVASGCYDAAGNQLLIPCDLMPHDNDLAYDAENRVRTETDGIINVVTTYGYDGDGRRVQKV
jgi:YD repeat-containing protein